MSIYSKRYVKDPIFVLECGESLTLYELEFSGRRKRITPSILVPQEMDMTVTEVDTSFTWEDCYQHTV